MVDSRVLRPGTRLVGRYLLTERHAGWPDEGPRSRSVWWAHDQLLSRRVWVCLLPATGADPALLEQARAAAALTGPCFARVLDVGFAAGQPFVVSEAIAAPSLGELLTEAPLAPAEAVDVLLGVADALAVAHAGGLAHGALRPHEVLLDDAAVRIALFDRPDPNRGTPTSPGPEADLRACGALLYAALTGYWPGPGTTLLPPAPSQGGGSGPAQPPAHVRAGVPATLDQLACVLLGVPRRGRVPAPVRSAEELRTALGRAAAALRHPALVVPAPRVPVPGSSTTRITRIEDAASRWPAFRLLRAAGAAAVGLLLAGLLLAGGQLGLLMLGDAPAGPPLAAPPGERSRTTTAALPVFLVHRVEVVDGPGQKHAPVPAKAPIAPAPPGSPRLAVDGDPATAWRTPLYRSRAPGAPSSGGTPGRRSAARGTAAVSSARPGGSVGLLLDLGTPRPVRTVNLVLVGGSSDVELRAGTRRAADPGTYPLVQAVQDVGPRITLVPSTRLTARYLLVQLSRLPAVPGSPGSYQGGIAEVIVRG